MKINWNNKYLTVSIYALLSVTAVILIYKFLNGFSGFDTVIGAISATIKPIAYGIIIAYLLSPIEKAFEYKFFPWISKNKLGIKARRYLSITLAYLILADIAAIILYVAIPQLIESVDKIIASFPLYYSYIEKWFAEFLKTEPGKLLSKNFDFTSVDIHSLLDSVQSMIDSSLVAVRSTLSTFLSILVNLVLGVVISIYLLCDRETYFRQIRKVLYAFFDNKKLDRFYKTCANTKEIFNNFMYGRLIECFIVGLVCYIGVLIMGVNNALLISCIVGITNFIPYFGPFIGTIPGVILIFFDGNGSTTNPTMAVIFLIFILILQQIDGNVLGPKIQGKSVGIPSFWVLISVIVFGHLFGVIGMLISVPIFAVLMSVLRVSVNERLQKKRLTEAPHNNE